MTKDDLKGNPNALENLTEAERADRENTYGPLFRFGEYKPGQSIRFMRGGREVVATVIWVTGPGSLPASGKHAPVTYITMIAGDMFPTLVYPTEILTSERPFNG